MGSPQGGFGQTSPSSLSSGGSGAGGGASAFGIAGLGLTAYSEVLKGQGVQAGDDYKAASLDNAAARGRVAAVQTGASETEKINTTLGMIDSIRAAAHTDPTSPTGAAVRDWNEQLGLTKKSIDVDNLVAQSQQEESDATYLRSAGKTALMSGYVNAGIDVTKALGQAALMGGS